MFLFQSRISQEGILMSLNFQISTWMLMWKTKFGVNLSLKKKTRLCSYSSMGGSHAQVCKGMLETFHPILTHLVLNVFVWPLWRRGMCCVRYDMFLQILVLKRLNHVDLLPVASVLPAGTLDCSCDCSVAHIQIFLKHLNWLSGCFPRMLSCQVDEIPEVTNHLVCQVTKNVS